MPKLTIEIDDDDLDELREAARIAGRTPEAFLFEEGMALARLVATLGSIEDVPLARHRQARQAQFAARFHAAGDADTAIRDWTAQRAVEAVATDRDRKPPDEIAPEPGGPEPRR